MRPPIDRAFRAKTNAEWVAILNAAGVANGEVRDIGQMLNDPQLAARNMVETLMHPTVGATRVIGAPIKLSENEASVRTPPPVLGQHTDAVLAEIGYDAETIAATCGRERQAQIGSRPARAAALRAASRSHRLR